MKYKLPYADGKFLLVEPSQAGQTLPTPGGGEITVPTLREIRQLEAVEETSAAAEGNWSGLQGALFVLGAALLVFALWFGGNAWQKMEPVPDAASEAPIPDEKWDRLAADQMYIAWQFFSGLDLDQAQPSMVQTAMNQRAALQTRLYASIAVGLAGLGLIIAAFLAPGREPRIASGPARRS